MNKLPEISIIIPVYNSEKFLHRCLDSVLNQSFTDFEIVCVNDGSTDSSKAILEAYAAVDGRVVLINKKNTGVSDTRNLGIKKSRGKYILFMDADDCIHPQLLEIAHFLLLFYNADIVNFGYIKKPYEDIKEHMVKSFDKNKVKHKLLNNVLRYFTDKTHGFSRWKIRHGYIWCHLFRRDIIKNIEFSKDIKIGEDLTWLVKIFCKKPRTVVAKIPLYFYIPNKNSALGNLQRMNYIENMTRALIEIWGEFAKANAQEKKMCLREIIWPVLVPIMRNIKYLNNSDDLYVAKQCVLKLHQAGMIKNPTGFKSVKCYFRIKRLLKK